MLRILKKLPFLCCQGIYSSFSIAGLKDTSFFFELYHALYNLLCTLIIFTHAKLRTY